MQKLGRFKGAGGEQSTAVYRPVVRGRQNSPLHVVTQKACGLGKKNTTVTDANLFSFFQRSDALSSWHHCQEVGSCVLGQAT